MRLGGFFAVASLLTAADWSTAQQPEPQMIVNPYFRPAPAETAPVSAMPTPAAKPLVRRTTNESNPIRALGAAVRSAAAAPQASTYVGRTPPLRFIPPADAKPLVASTPLTQYDPAVVAAAATESAPVFDSQSAVAPAINGSLAEAVAANLQVTHLASNPLRGGEPSRAAPPTTTIRAANPLR